MPTPPRRLPAAVLWDMDGTLVDTEPYWIQTEFEIAAEHGATWTEELALELVGRDLLDSGAFIRTHMGIDLTPAQIVDRLLDGVVEHVQREVPWRPGARELLADLRAAGVRCGLVTMSWARFATPVVESLPPASFEVVVTGDAVSRGKPDPEAYLVAARRLGLEPADCVAIEDSTPGATSARDAGCQVLVVPHHVPVPPQPGFTYAETLEGVDAAGLLAMLPSNDGASR